MSGDEIAQYKRRIADLRAEIEDYEAEEQILEKTIDSQQEKIATLRSQCNKDMRLIEELRAELETSDAERDRLNEVIERQAAEIERLAAARTADTPTRGSATPSAELQRIKDEVERERELQDARERDLFDTIKQYEETLRAERNKKRELKREVVELRDQLETASGAAGGGRRRTLSDSDEDNGDLEGMLRRTMAEKRAAESAKDKLLREFEKMEQVLIETKIEMANTQFERDELGLKVNKLKKKLATTAS